MARARAFGHAEPTACHVWVWGRNMDTLSAVPQRGNLGRGKVTLNMDGQLKAPARLLSGALERKHPVPLTT